MSKREALSHAEIVAIGKHVLADYTVEDWWQAPPSYTKFPAEAMLLEIPAMRIGAGATFAETTAELAAASLEIYLQALGILEHHAEIRRERNKPAYIVASSETWDFVRTQLYGQ